MVFYSVPCLTKCWFSAAQNSCLDQFWLRCRVKIACFSWQWHSSFLDANCLFIAFNFGDIHGQPGCEHWSKWLPERSRGIPWAPGRTSAPVFFRSHLLSWGLQACTSSLFQMVPVRPLLLSNAISPWNFHVCPAGSKLSFSLDTGSYTLSSRCTVF